MSIINLISVLPFGHRQTSFRGASPASVRNWFKASALWRERVRGRRDLMRLSEHQLQDIGLSRLDAEMEWGKPFWRP